jgi:hypothetical protein
MMSNARVFFAGAPIPGREQKALQFFSEVIKFYTQKKDKGEIDIVESLVFDDFNAEFGGITIIRGDPDKLEKFSSSDEAVSFGHRGELLFKNFRMVRGFAGENMQWRLANLAKQVAELLK